MDIRFREDKPGTIIFSQPAAAIVYINPEASWSEVMRIAPVYDRNEIVYMPIVDFMIKALGWEAMILAVFRSQGERVSLSLDAAVGASQDFFDMFLDIHY